MDSRREFLKKAALLSAGFTGTLPASIQKAFAIDPQPGTTYLDAEHIVILMQENRSFDHTYGTLQGVRGFNDPRAIDLPTKNKVWFQTNAAGETYAPFRLNLRETKATWMHSLPHSWENQVDARNGGKHDKWLDFKKSGNKDYAQMPLTLGYYNREDLPFYYALADAFTVCDQNFCSSLTGTTPNRLYLWTGTLRDPRDPKAMANVRNENVDYGSEVSWKTFPERLEEAGISWKIYQNEISLPTGLEGEEENWLGNFTDNPIEWFSQFRVRFHPAYYSYIHKQITILPGKIKELEATLSKLTENDNEFKQTQRQLDSFRSFLKIIQSDLSTYSPEKFKNLSQRDQNLHEKAFTTNVNDPDYRTLETISYEDNGVKRTVKIPKGDVLHQFRQDVKNKQLPTVSWIVAPENFSDHPGAPWYGAWYLSEVMDILTQNPDVWKKTIFVLCYDENDGYFDHVPPFVPAHPDQPETGLTSKGIDTRLEFVTQEQESKRKQNGRTGPIGLGYRVPLVIASPWSRGGYVCSEVFDHTSILQMMENILNHKKTKQLKETNISDWRRTICGDLSSAFRPYNGEKIKLPTAVARIPFIEGIHKAQFKRLPSGYKIWTQDEIADQNPAIARQEKGIRPACVLPYNLTVNALSKNGKLEVQFGSKNTGAPFQVFDVTQHDPVIKSYTVAKNDQLSDVWPAESHLKVYGPNGFFREFKHVPDGLEVRCLPQYATKNQATGNVLVTITNTNKNQAYTIQISDNAYHAKPQRKKVSKAGGKESQISVLLDLKTSYNWYDFSVLVNDQETHRFAGRIETGKEGFTDPLMGEVFS
ncbi:MAG: phospholipase C, phosphocholine-specific [Siphonobacter sp.]